MKPFIALGSFVLCTLVSVLALASKVENPSPPKKEKIVFVVNTQATDSKGGGIVGAPYLNEAEAIRSWQSIHPDAKVIRIRADSNEELTTLLRTWMRPDPSKKEVVGLFVDSHGGPMLMQNESKKFTVNLPSDMATVFAPIVGHFAANARVVLGGCSLLERMSDVDAKNSLHHVLKFLKIKEGSIYANSTLGLKSTNRYRNIDLLNPDIAIKEKVIAGGVYALWPLTLPTFPLIEKYFDNQGFFLEKSQDGLSLYKTSYFAAMKPTLSIQQDVIPLLSETTEPPQKLESVRSANTERKSLRKASGTSGQR